MPGGRSLHSAVLDPQTDSLVRCRFNFALVNICTVQYSFGGWGRNSDGVAVWEMVHNDMWRFDTGTRQWTWVHGCASGDGYDYGIMRVAVSADHQAFPQL